MSDSTYSIAVIGAGIIGVCCAIELKSAGYEVELIDKDQIATSCCSIGNTGQIGSDIFPLAQPNLILSIPKLITNQNSGLSIPLKTLPQTSPWLMGFVKSAFGKKYQQSTEAMRYLSSRCITDALNLFKQVGIEEDIKKTGCLFLYKNDNEFKQALKQWEIKKQMGFDYQIFQSEELKKIEPRLKKNKFAYAVLTKYWAKVSDPKEVLIKLFNHAQKIGVSFNQARVNTIRNLNHQIELDLMIQGVGQGSKKYHKVLVASGIGSLSLAKEIGEKLPIVAERGYAITFSDANFELRQPILMRTIGLSASSLTSGLRFGGLAEITTENYKTNPNLYTIIKDTAEKYFDIKGLKEPNEWMNSRPATFDSAPILSESLKMKHLYFASGHGHWGVTFSASSAKIMKEIMTNNKIQLPKEYQYYSLKRF